jgi:hypothetical protein
LLTHYAQIDFFMDMDMDDLGRQIDIATERSRDDKIWERWLPYQDQISFDEFKKQVVNSLRSKKDDRKAEDILLHVKKLMNKFERG